MSDFSGGLNHKVFEEAQAPSRNYRHLVAECIPAALLAYQMIVWPMINPQMARALSPLSAMNFIVFPILAIAAFSIWILEKPRVPRGSMRSVTLLGLFWLYSMTSSLWADNPASAFSDTRPNTLLFVALFFSCATAQKIDNVLLSIFLVAGATVAFNALFVIATPAGPIGHEGIYTHKNEFGAISALCVLVAMSQIRSSHRWIPILALATIGVGLIELDASDSKTSLGFAIMTPFLAFGIVFVQRHFRVPAVVQMLVYTAIVFFIFWLGAVSFGFGVENLSMLVSGEPTFTGRVGLWDFARDNIAKKPIWGHGYNSFWQIGTNSASHDAAPGFVKVATSGHSTYIDLLLHGGVIALGMVILSLVAMWGQISRVIERDTRFGFFLCNTLLFLILQSLLEAGWFNSSAPMGTFVVLMAFLPLVGQDSSARITAAYRT